MFECEAEVSISAAARVTTTTTATTTSLPAKKKVRSTFLTKMIVHEALTVMQLKELLLASWGSLLPIEEGLPLPPTPLSANHIRLRDAKVPGSSGLGTFMRSERVLYRCLLGISDGRKIVVQVSQACSILPCFFHLIDLKVIDCKVFFNRVVKV